MSNYKNLINCNDVICRNLEEIYKNPKSSSAYQNTLPQLRNLVEALIISIYDKQNITETDIIDLDVQLAKNIKKNAIEYISGNQKFINLYHFYELTNWHGTNHITYDLNHSIRLLNNLLPNLIELKNISKSELNLNILQNICDFPFNLDDANQEYYKQISNVINNKIILNEVIFEKEKFYVNNIKHFFVNKKIYYEISLSPAIDNNSKFNTFVVFSEIKILSNYAIKIAISEYRVNLLDNEFNIKVLNNYEVSIRGCEFANFASILYGASKNNYQTNEYKFFMNILKKYHINLVDIVDLSEKDYKLICSQIPKNKNNIKNKFNIKNILDTCRKFNKEKLHGVNTIKYLLFNLKNVVIKKQLGVKNPEYENKLWLRNETLLFEKAPYAFSLKEHNPSFSNLIKCINPSEKLDEILYRTIKETCIQRNQIYLKKNQLKSFKNIELLVEKYNHKAYYHNDHLEICSNLIYIKNNEEDILSILKYLKKYEGSLTFFHSAYKKYKDTNVLDEKFIDKYSEINKMFQNNSISLICGPAGTGKTEMVKILSKILEKYKKLFLSNTHTSIKNLKDRTSNINSFYKTIKSFIMTKSENEYDVVFIEECSSISNHDLLKILEKLNTRILVFIGDNYQIESINLGNWFSFLINSYYINNNCLHELKNTWRTTEDKLKEIWNTTRKKDKKIAQMLIKYGYSKKIDSSIFIKNSDDEIILCHGYNGFYGINNINKIIQSKNNNREIEWNSIIYKVDDPIIFTETNRFYKMLHNALKGKIKKIEINNEKTEIVFDIEVNICIKEVNELYKNDIQIISTQNDRTTIRFCVFKSNFDNDSRNEYNVPFQIAYAMSIHKSQGLEYESVKIVITNDDEKFISHNIFYTAITRSKKFLTIFWSSNTEREVIENITKKNKNNDFHIINWKMEKQ